MRVGWCKPKILNPDVFPGGEDDEERKDNHVNKGHMTGFSLGYLDATVLRKQQKVLTCMSARGQDSLEQL